MAVTHLLEQHFPRLVDIGFTAEMEKTLDDIAVGQANEKAYLRDFYLGREGLAEQVKAKESVIDARAVCTLHLEGIRFDIRVGRFGPYVEINHSNGETQTVSLPADMAPGDLTNEVIEQVVSNKERGPQSLGLHPTEKLPIFVLIGPFGPYVQLGENGEDGKKPKRVSIPKNLSPDTLTLEQAVALLDLPRTLGPHPEDGKVVKASIGRFGPYVVHDGVYKSLGKQHDVLTIGLDEAVGLLKQARTRKKAEPLRSLGKHPENGEEIGVFEGRYGPYVKLGKINASLPKGRAVESLTLEEALELLKAKADKPTKATVRRRKKAG
jgi:DNA topoisomerase-1